MTDTRSNHPLDPMEDQVLDRYLASLGRFSPGPGFEDRVMARVHVAGPAPLAAPAAVPAVHRRRWPALAWPASGAAALSSTALTAWLAFNFETLTAWALIPLKTGIPSIVSGFLTWLAAAGASSGRAVVTAVTSGGQPLLWMLLFMNLAVPVSLLGLYLTARPAVRMRSHAAR